MDPHLTSPKGRGSRRIFPPPGSAILYPLIFIALVGMACVLSNPTPAAWALTPSAQAQSASSTAFAATQATPIQPPPPSTPIPTTNPPTPTTLIASLSAKSPWLLYPTHGGQVLVALNPDGSAATPVTIPPLLDPADLASGMSPKGGIAAFRTGLRSNPVDAALYLLSLPSGRLQLITSLLSPDEQNLYKAGKDSRALEAAVGITQRDSLAWSPDGRYLAFIGALERDSADLYLYDTTTEKITRMTFGANYYATPFWSRDGNWIYIQEVMSFGGGTAWTPGAVWAVDVQTDLLYKIYSPPVGSTGEVFLGWINDTTFLCYSQAGSGGEALRVVDISHDQATTLFAGAFIKVATDPKSGVTAFITSGGSAGSGLYLIAPGAAQPALVQAGNWQDLTWSPQANEFLASGTQGILTVTPSGTQALVAGEDHAAPSPDGTWLACWGDSASGDKAGLRLYRTNGELFQVVSTDSIQALAWRPDSKGFFFIAGAHLNMATFPSLQVTTIDGDLKPGTTPTLVWIY